MKDFTEYYTQQPQRKYSSQLHIKLQSWYIIYLSFDKFESIEMSGHNGIK